MAEAVPSLHEPVVYRSCIVFGGLCSNPNRTGNWDLKSVKCRFESHQTHPQVTQPKGALRRIEYRCPAVILRAHGV